MKRYAATMVLILFLGGALFAGVEWESKMTMSGEKMKPSVVTMRLYAQGGNVRQDFVSVEGKNPAFVPGTYWIFNVKDGGTMIWVNPKEKTYSELPMGPMMQMVGAVGKLMKISIDNPELKLENLPSESVLGIPCQHYRMVMDYDMQVKIAFIKDKSHQRQEKEVWAAPLKGWSDVGEAFRHKDLKTGFDELDALIEKQVKAEAGKGFPLKMVMVTTAEKKGKVREASRMTQEVTAFAAKTIPASMFEVPAGFTKTASGLPGTEE
ncbi:MAG TPA: DUF4412 domain-containing protein [Candidatus Aminicenantes bacterium]|nr:DUF4412 domain-containing protein [Candidatus Aminicenantes bacterium]